MMLQRVGDAFVVSAPAKLNLFLEILRRRDDGFHEIETLMRTIAWHDTLDFRPTATSQITLDCRWASGIEARQSGKVPQVHGTYEDLPPSDDNLVLRAARLMQQESGTDQGAVIRLRKRIPSAAGLGGASADAAATIFAANVAWKLAWPVERLREIAAQLGSDIPFFLGERMAICRGRGEIIEPVPDNRQRFFVIIKPPFGLSTPAVYKACRVPEQPKRIDPIFKQSLSLKQGFSRDSFFNRLEEPARELAPELGRLSNDLERLAGSRPLMSGSGTSHFVPCHNAKHARRVAALADMRGLGAVCCSVA